MISILSQIYFQSKRILLFKDLPLTINKLQQTPYKNLEEYCTTYSLIMSAKETAINVYDPYNGFS